MTQDRNRGGGIKNPYVRFQKLDRPKLDVFSSTLWDYPSQNYGKGRQGAQGYRGATPSYVIWQVLSRYTKPGDVVLDSFCGSGTTLDVCRDLGREGVGFDVAPFRDDIKKGDARSLPLDDNSVDHAFLDPPYADNLQYSDDPNCIGKLRGDGAYQAAMERVFDETVRVVRPGGTISVFVSDVKKADAFFALGAELWAMLVKVAIPEDHVVVVRHGKKVEDGVNRQSLFGPTMVRAFSHLLIFRVPAQQFLRRPAPQAPAQPAARTDQGGRGQGTRKPKKPFSPHARPQRKIHAKKGDEPRATERPLPRQDGGGIKKPSSKPPTRGGRKSR